MVARLQRFLPPFPPRPLLPAVPRDCMVALITCRDSRYAARRRQAEEWLMGLAALGWNTLAADGDAMGVPDGYGALPQKVLAVMRMAHRAGMRGLWKVDDDVKVLPALLPVPDADYLGRLSPEGNGPRYCLGGCYWVSGRAIGVLASSVMAEGEWAEDRHAGAALAAAGIYPEDGSSVVGIRTDPSRLGLLAAVTEVRFPDPEGRRRARTGGPRHG